MRLVCDIALGIVEDIVLEILMGIEVLVNLIDLRDECTALLIGVSDSSKSVP